MSGEKLGMKKINFSACRRPIKKASRRSAVQKFMNFNCKLLMPILSLQLKFLRIFYRNRNKKIKFIKKRA